LVSDAKGGGVVGKRDQKAPQGKKVRELGSVHGEEPTLETSLGNEISKCNNLTEALRTWNPSYASRGGETRGAIALPIVLSAEIMEQRKIKKVV